MVDSQPGVIIWMISIDLDRIEVLTRSGGMADNLHVGLAGTAVRSRLQLFLIEFEAHHKLTCIDKGYPFPFKVAPAIGWNIREPCLFLLFIGMLLLRARGRCIEAKQSEC
jgi:hypothetical protein